MGYYVKDAKKAQPAFMQEVLGCEAKRTAAEEKKTFHGILKDVISEEVEDAKTVILDIQQDLNARCREKSECAGIRGRKPEAKIGGKGSPP